MSYLTQGMFPLREGTTYGLPPQSQAVLLSWGLWEVPEADNDEVFQPPPSYA